MRKPMIAIVVVLYLLLSGLEASADLKVQQGERVVSIIAWLQSQNDIASQDQKDRTQTSTVAGSGTGPAL